MSATPSSRSLLRLVLGAAFVLLGWVLASSTSAQADDRGVLGSTVSELGSSLDSTLDSALSPEKTTAPVRTVVEKAATTLEATVDEATATVDRTVDVVPVAATAPVKAVTKAVTKTVRDTTRATTGRVVVPTVEVVTDVVDVVTGTVGSLPGPVVPLPGAGGPLVPGLDPGTGGPDPISSTTDRAPLGTSSVPGTDATVRVSAVATGPWVAPLSGRSSVSGSPATSPELPNDHGPVVPDLDLSGLAPSAATGSSIALLLVAMGMAFVLLRPEIFVLAPRFAAVRPVPGPAADPGSRPD